MTRTEFEGLLADYLAGELDAAARAAVDDYLRGAPDDARLVAEYRAAQRAAAADLVPLAEAGRRTRGMRWSPEPAECDAARREAERPVAAGALARRTRLAGVVRAAALIVLTFAAGVLTGQYLSAARAGSPSGPAMASSVGGPGGAAAREPAPLNPQWARGLEQAASRYPGGMTLTWASLSMARR